jgi:thioredoxin-related protein
MLSLLFYLLVHWGTNLESALDQAGKEEKLVLLNFSGSDWCAPCIQLKKEIFESDDFKGVAEARLVLVRADFPRMKKNQLPADQKAYNEQLAEKFNPQGKFPLTLLLNPEGKVIQTWDGYPKSMSKEKFIETIRNAK